MKKIITSVVAILISFSALSIVDASEYSKFPKKFIKKFRDCDAYEEVVYSKFQDKDFTTVRKIIGWRNGFCKYQSTVKSNEGTYRINCSLTPAQVDDLYESMTSKSKEPEQYPLELFAPTTDPNTGETKYVRAGTTIIKGNKAYITWAKYENNPYFCKSEKID